MKAFAQKDPSIGPLAACCESDRLKGIGSWECCSFVKAVVPSIASFEYAYLAVERQVPAVRGVCSLSR